MPLKSWQVLLAGVIATVSMDVLTTSPSGTGRLAPQTVAAQPGHRS